MAKQQRSSSAHKAGPAKAGKRKMYLSPSDPRATGHPNNPAYGSRKAMSAKAMADWRSRRKAAKQAAA